MITTQPDEQDLLAWQQRLEASLRRENGWLALAGLEWLHPGRNTFGSAPDDELNLPPAAGGHLGELELLDEQVLLHPAAGQLRAGGEPIRGTLPLKVDVSGEPTHLQANSLDMIVIQRRQRFGLRVWDNASPRRQSFTGRRWYPFNPAYQLSARYLPVESPRTIAVPDASGDTQDMEINGVLEFELGGQVCRLEASDEGDSLFIVFRDLTSGKSTYGAGRFLYAPLPENGQVALDFNRAYNPPCAFTPYATCPLPPPQNRLKIPVEAGELDSPLAAQNH